MSCCDDHQAALIIIQPIPSVIGEDNVVHEVAMSEPFLKLWIEPVFNFRKNTFYRD